MLAAAIDEKDPYTRGHSGRVAKYSMLIGQELGLSAEELDKLRIAALYDAVDDAAKAGMLNIYAKMKVTKVAGTPHSIAARSPRLAPRPT